MKLCKVTIKYHSNLINLNNIQNQLPIIKDKLKETRISIAMNFVAKC